MQFTSLLTAALLPLGLLAAPSPVAEGDAADIAAREPAPGVSANDKVDVLSRRELQICFIVGGSSTVNCRSGPGTNYRVVTTVAKDNLYWFSCVKSGECVTINGEKNWLVRIFYLPRHALMIVVC